MIQELDQVFRDFLVESQENLAELDQQFVDWERDPTNKELLAAKFYLSNGKQQIARAYMQEARSGYRAWEASAKVRDLEQRYPMLLTSGHDHTLTDRYHGQQNIHLKLTDTSTPETSAEILDLRCH